MNEKAPQVLHAISMRNTRHMANAYGLLGMLSLSAFPARVENPHDNAGNLAWIRDCEQQLRQCANHVGVSFIIEVIPLFNDVEKYVSLILTTTSEKWYQCSVIPFLP